MAESLIFSCDLGGTKMLTGLLSYEGDLLTVDKYLVGERSAPAEVLDDLHASLNRMLQSTERQYTDVCALGFGSTGVLDLKAGIVVMNHNLGWFEVPLGELAAQRFGLPVTLEMDANAAALGELWQGAGKGLESFAFVIIGTGIGAGLVLDGRILHGAHSAAGEVGHTVVLPSGPLCGCGKHGCLEALASGLAISRRAEAAVKLGRATALRPYAPVITGQQVAEAARAGDAVAREIIEEAAYYLGIGVANIITLLDPQAVILGGGIGAGAFDLLQAPMNRAVQQHLNYWAARDIPIRPSALGEYAGLYGAARAALDQLPHVIIDEVQK